MNFQILKLTEDCEFEYLPERMLRGNVLEGRCAVVGEAVWHCFGRNHRSFCQSWSDNVIRQSLTSSKFGMKDT